MKYIKSINESIFSDSYNKKIKDFIQSTKDEFKSSIDECMYDLLDDFQHNSGFDDQNYNSGFGDICVYYNIFIPDNQPLGEYDPGSTFSNNLKNVLTRLISIKCEFTLQIIYLNNPVMSSDVVIMSNASSKSGTIVYRDGLINFGRNVNQIVNTICFDMENIKYKRTKYTHMNLSFRIF
jgi:hypothetical protein